MKERLKSLLKNRDLYYPLKYSRLFRLYQFLFKPGEVKRHRSEIAFYRSFLPACELIFDIGAYDGHKTEAFLALAKKIVCCEPDEENFKVLKIRFRNRKNRVIIENKALSDREGPAELYVHHDASAFNTLSKRWVKLLEEDDRKKWDETIRFSRTRTIESTTLDRLIAKYGVPDFIKIDVEGLEQWVLKGLSHRVAYLSFETLLPEYSGELQSCLSSIEQICPSAIYNVALDEKLVLDSFVDKPGLNQWLNSQQPTRGFEIIVKMPGA